MTLEDIIKSREKSVSESDAIIVEMKQEISKNTKKVFEKIMSDLCELAKARLNIDKIEILYDLYNIKIVGNKLHKLVFEHVIDELVIQSLIDTFKKLENLNKRKLTKDQIDSLISNYSYMKGLYFIVGEECNLISLQELKELLKNENIDTIEKEESQIEGMILKLNVQAILPTKEEIHERALKPVYEFLD